MKIIIILKIQVIVIDYQKIILYNIKVIKHKNKLI